MEEVKIILEYYPVGAEDFKSENSNWRMALRAHNKSFVAHHYYQNFHRERLMGKTFQWDNFYPFYKYFYIHPFTYPYLILLYLTFPIVVLIDAIFRKADILFLSPEALQAQKVPQARQDGHNTEIEMQEVNEENEQKSKSNMEHPVFEFFRRNIHRPIFRLIFQHFMDIVFLLSLALTLIDPLDEGAEVSDSERRQQVHLYDIITAVLVTTNLVESIIDLASRRWHSFSSFWQIYNLFTFSLLTAGGLLYYLAFQTMDDDIRANKSGNDPVNIGSAIFAMGASMAFLTPLRWFLLNRSLGPVVVCCIKVLKDAADIFIIFIVVFVAFSIPCYFIFKPFSMHNEKYYLHQDDLVTLKGLFGVMFWRVFDAGQPHYAAILLNGTDICIEDGNTNKDDKFDVNCLSGQFSHVMSMAMWAVYQSITVILLLNILIALSMP